MLADMGHCEHIPDETFRWGTTNYVTCVGDFIGWIKKEASGIFFCNQTYLQVHKTILLHSLVSRYAGEKAPPANLQSGK